VLLRIKGMLIQLGVRAGWSVVLGRREGKLGKAGGEG
jgi:hypothetical protein